MNVTGLILLGAGFLLGNEPARIKFGNAVQQLVGTGIDMLNRTGGQIFSTPNGGDENVTVEPDTQE